MHGSAVAVSGFDLFYKILPASSTIYWRDRQTRGGGVLIAVCNSISSWLASTLEVVHKCESFDPGLYRGLSHSKNIRLKYAQNFVQESIRNACLETLLTSQS